ncbi:MAG: membrane protein insertion efficiency factor YidD [Verrucomicrobiota bacterium]|nr:membrane protein insertion efficiency factor YidD [Verrucomicrobiota bacterium]
MTFVIRFLIRGYQWLISPILSWLAGPGAGCRFEPPCSHYFLGAVEVHGALHGSWLGLKRLARCHPWGGNGYDPVPAGSRAARKPGIRRSKSETTEERIRTDDETDSPAAGDGPRH